MQNVHSSYDLTQMQLLPLDAKIRMTKQRIQQWYYAFDGEVYVSLSGGKDSTVLKHIVDSMFSDVPSVFVNTGLEYPEIQKFVSDIKEGKFECFNSDVEIIYPKKRFYEVITEMGYPVISKEIAHKMHDYNSAKQKGHESYVERKFNGTYISKNGKTGYSISRWKFLTEAPFKISHKCCDVMKKQPTKEYEKRTGRKPFLGTMADESIARKQMWMKFGCNAFEKGRQTSQPMSFWTENDVLTYLLTYNVPYCPVYGNIVETGDYCETLTTVVPELKTTGCDRTGCMFCMFGCHLNKDQRFVRMKETHPKQYEYCMKSIDEGGLGLKDVIDWLNENGNTKIEY